MPKHLHTGKSFFDISVNTNQIGMGFEADTLENESNMSILAIFGQRSGSKVIDEQTNRLFDQR